MWSLSVKDPAGECKILPNDARRECCFGGKNDIVRWKMWSLPVKNPAGECKILPNDARRECCFGGNNSKDDKETVKKMLKICTKGVMIFPNQHFCVSLQM